MKKLLLTTLLATAVIATQINSAASVESYPNLERNRPNELSFRTGAVPLSFDKSLGVFGQYKPLSSEGLKMLPKIDSLSPFLFGPPDPAAPFSGLAFTGPRY